MNRWISLLALFLAAAAVVAVVVQRLAPPPAPVAPVPAPLPPPAPPAPTRLDAAQIDSGRLAMERLPAEVGKALETYSEEIVRNAEVIETKQARIHGTCAPGSAIRVIAEDGSVRCQAFPRGVASVSAVSAVPRLSTTVTEAGIIKGGVGRYQFAGADDYLVAPVLLPDGAIITGFSYVFYDAEATADSEAFLYRSDDQPLASVSSAGAEERLRTVSTESIQLKKIDAGRYAYFVYFQVSAAAGARLMPVSASVSYRLP